MADDLLVNPLSRQVDPFADIKREREEVVDATAYLDAPEYDRVTGRTPSPVDPYAEQSLVGRQLEAGVQDLGTAGNYLDLAWQVMMGDDEGRERAMGELETSQNRAQAMASPDMVAPSDISSPTELVEFIAGTLARSAPAMIGTAPLGGGVGGLVGKSVASRAVSHAAANLAKKMSAEKAAEMAAIRTGQLTASSAANLGRRKAGEYIAKGVAEKTAQTAGYAKAGAYAGAGPVGMGYPQLAENTQTILDNRDSENLGELLTVGLLTSGGQGVLEMVPWVKGLGRMGTKFKGLAESTEGLLGRVGKAAATEAVLSGGTEGITEGLQTLMSQAFADYATGEGFNMTDKDLDEFYDALLGGFLVGGALGGAGGGITQLAKGAKDTFAEDDKRASYQPGAKIPVYPSALGALKGEAAEKSFNDYQQSSEELVQASIEMQLRGYSREIYGDPEALSKPDSQLTPEQRKEKEEIVELVKQMALDEEILMSSHLSEEIDGGLSRNDIEGMQTLLRQEIDARIQLEDQLREMEAFNLLNEERTDTYGLQETGMSYAALEMTKEISKHRMKADELQYMIGLAQTQGVVDLGVGRSSTENMGDKAPVEVNEEQAEIENAFDALDEVDTNQQRAGIDSASKEAPTARKLNPTPLHKDTLTPERLANSEAGKTAWRSELDLVMEETAGQPQDVVEARIKARAEQLWDMQQHRTRRRADGLEGYGKQLSAELAGLQEDLSNAQSQQEYDLILRDIQGTPASPGARRIPGVQEKLQDTRNSWRYFSGERLQQQQEYFSDINRDVGAWSDEEFVLQKPREFLESQVNEFEATQSAYERDSKDAGVLPSVDELPAFYENNWQDVLGNWRSKGKTRTTGRVADIVKAGSQAYDAAVKLSKGIEGGLNGEDLNVAWRELTDTLNRDFQKLVLVPFMGANGKLKFINFSNWSKRVGPQAAMLHSGASIWGEKARRVDMFMQSLGAIPSEDTQAVISSLRALASAPEAVIKEGKRGDPQIYLYNSQNLKITLKEILAEVDEVVHFKENDKHKYVPKLAKGDAGFLTDFWRKDESTQEAVEGVEEQQVSPNDPYPVNPIFRDNRGFLAGTLEAGLRDQVPAGMEVTSADKTHKDNVQAEEIALADIRRQIEAAKAWGVEQKGRGAPEKTLAKARARIKEFQAVEKNIVNKIEQLENKYQSKVDEEAVYTYQSKHLGENATLKQIEDHIKNLLAAAKGEKTVKQQEALIKSFIPVTKRNMRRGAATQDVQVTLSKDEGLHVKKIISGGQTGGDIAGLKAGKALGLATGGTAPKGYKTSTGANAELGSVYGLDEDTSSAYVPRTMKNVDSADGTVAFMTSTVRSVGTSKTIGYAKTGKWGYPSNYDSSNTGKSPVLVLDPQSDIASAARRLKEFLIENGIETLNVAGHRESSVPGLEKYVEKVIVAAMSETKPVTKRNMRRGAEDTLWVEAAGLPAKMGEGAVISHRPKTNAKELITPTTGKLYVVEKVATKGGKRFFQVRPMKASDTDIRRGLLNKQISKARVALKGRGEQNAARRAESLARKGLKQGRVQNDAVYPIQDARNYVRQELKKQIQNTDAKVDQLKLTRLFDEIVAEFPEAKRLTGQALQKAMIRGSKNYQKKYGQRVFKSAPKNAPEISSVNSVGTALKYILAHTKSPVHKAVLRHVLKVLPGNYAVRIWDGKQPEGMSDKVFKALQKKAEEGNHNAVAYYYGAEKASGIMVFNTELSGPEMATVLAHEFIHGATQAAVANPVSLAQQKAVASLETLRKALIYSKKLTKNQLKDIDELLAYGLSDAELQKTMQDIDLRSIVEEIKKKSGETEFTKELEALLDSHKNFRKDGNSLWRFFVGAIRSLLGVRPKAESALEMLVIQSDALISDIQFEVETKGRRGYMTGYKSVVANAHEKTLPLADRNTVKSLETAVDFVMKYTANPVHRALLKKIVKLIPKDYKVQWFDEVKKDQLSITMSTKYAEFKEQVGTYDSPALALNYYIEAASTDYTGMLLNPEKPENFSSVSLAQTIAHELVHAATMHWVNRVALGKEGIPVRIKKGVEALENIRQTVLKTPEMQKYETKDVNELLAYGRTDAGFQRELRKIKYEGSNAFVAMLKAVGRILGFNIKEQNAYEAMMEQSEKLFESIDKKGRVGLPDKNAVAFATAGMQQQNTPDDYDSYQDYAQSQAEAVVEEHVRPNMPDDVRVKIQEFMDLVKAAPGSTRENPRGASPEAAALVANMLASPDTPSRIRGFLVADAVLLNEKDRGLLNKALRTKLVQRQVKRTMTRETWDALMKEDPAIYFATVFDLWRNDLVRLGPKTDSVFQRILEKVRGILGIVTKYDRSKQLLLALSDANNALLIEKTQFPDTQLYQDKQLINNKAQAWASHVRSASEMAGAVASKWIEPPRDVLQRANNPYINKIIKKFSSQFGVDSGGDFDAAIQQQHGVWNAKIEEILAHRDQAFLDRWGRYMRTRETPTDPELKKAVLDSRRVLKDFQSYMGEAGVHMGKVKYNYFERLWDTEVIAANKDEFVDFLVENMILPTKEKDEDGNIIPVENIASEVMWAILTNDGVDPEIDINDFRHTPAMNAARKRKLLFKSNKKGKMLEADIQRMEKLADKFKQKDSLGTLATYLHAGIKKAEYTRRFGANGHVLASMLDDARDNGMTREQGEILEDWIQAQLGIPAAKINNKLRTAMGWSIVGMSYAILPGILLASGPEMLGSYFRSRGDKATKKEAYGTMIKELVRKLKREKKSDLRKMYETLGTVESRMFADLMNRRTVGTFLSGKQRRAMDFFFEAVGISPFTRWVRVGATAGAIKFIAENKENRKWMAELGLKESDVVVNQEGDLKLMTQEEYFETMRSVEDQLAERSKLWMEDDGIHLSVFNNDGHISAAESARLDEIKSRLDELEAEIAPVEEKIKRDSKLKAAVVQWVNGASIRPNPAIRPAYFNDPRFMLMAYLKDFIYGSYDVIVKQMIELLVEPQDNVFLGDEKPTGRKRITPEAWTMIQALVAFGPAYLMGEILRDLIQHGADDDPNKRGWTWSDHTINAYMRSGLLGPGEFIKDAHESVGMNRFFGRDFLGPFAGRAMDFTEAVVSDEEGALTNLGSKLLPGQAVWRYWGD